jgi:hypothetical protein
MPRLRLGFWGVRRQLNLSVSQHPPATVRALTILSTVLLTGACGRSAQELGPGEWALTMQTTTPGARYAIPPARSISAALQLTPAALTPGEISRWGPGTRAGRLEPGLDTFFSLPPGSVDTASASARGYDSVTYQVAGDSLHLVVRPAAGHGGLVLAGRRTNGGASGTWYHELPGGSSGTFVLRP